MDFNVDRQEEQRVAGMLQRLETANRLPHTELRVSSDDELSAHYVEGKGSYIMAGTKATQAMDADELAFMLGHQLARVHCRHDQIADLVSSNASQIESEKKDMSQEGISQGTDVVAKVVQSFHDYEADVIGARFAQVAGFDGVKGLEKRAKRLPEDELFMDMLEGTFMRYEEHPALIDRVTMLRSVDVSKIQFDVPKREQYYQYLDVKSKSIEGRHEVENLMLDRLLPYANMVTKTVERRLDASKGSVSQDDLERLSSFKPVIDVERELSAFTKLAADIPPKRKQLHDMYQNLSDKAYQHLTATLEKVENRKVETQSFDDFSIPTMQPKDEPVKSSWQDRIDSKEDALALMRQVGKDCLEKGKLNGDIEQVHVGRAFMNYSKKLEPSMYLKEDVLNLSGFIVDKTHGKAGNMQAHVDEYVAGKNVVLGEADKRDDRKNIQR